MFLCPLSPSWIRLIAIVPSANLRIFAELWEVQSFVCKQERRWHNVCVLIHQLCRSEYVPVRAVQVGLQISCFLPCPSFCCSHHRVGTFKLLYEYTVSNWDCRSIRYSFQWWLSPFSPLNSSLSLCIQCLPAMCICWACSCNCPSSTITFVTTFCLSL